MDKVALFHKQLSVQVKGSSQFDGECLMMKWLSYMYETVTKLSVKLAMAGSARLLLLQHIQNFS